MEILQKRFNEHVKNNIEKFPERYMFRLTKHELDYFARSKKSTSQIWATHEGGRAYLPYAFTEQEIYVLITMLEGEKYERQ